MAAHRESHRRQMDGIHQDHAPEGATESLRGNVPHQAGAEHEGGPATVEAFHGAQGDGPASFVMRLPLPAAPSAA